MTFKLTTLRAVLLGVVVSPPAANVNVDAQQVLPIVSRSMSTSQTWKATRDTTDTIAGQDQRAPACMFEGYGCESSASGYLEEDNFQLQALSPHTDRNYTMGLGIALSGAVVPEYRQDVALRGADWVAAYILDATLGRIRVLSVPTHFDAILNQRGRPKSYSELLAGTAFTPEALYDPNIRLGDRPYAFLLGWTVQRSAIVDSAERTSVTTGFTIGTLGSRLGRNVQRFIHRWRRGPKPCDPAQLPRTGPCDPKGWSHQIEDVPSVVFGVPTLRYGAMVEHLWSPRYVDSLRRIRWIEFVGGVGGEAGYYTDAYVSARARLGYFSSPFYAFWENPLTVGSILSDKVQFLQDSIGNQRMATTADTIRPRILEGYLYAGARPRAWAYNALLQGYPGYRGYAFSRAAVRTFETDGELGGTVLVRIGHERRWSIAGTFELLAEKSPEFISALQRKHAWGGLFITVTRSQVAPVLAIVHADGHK